MMRTETDVRYVSRMHEAASAALTFVGDHAFTELLNDNRRMTVLLRAIELLDRSARCVSSEFCEEHIDVPWDRVLGIYPQIVYHKEGLHLENLYYFIVEVLSPLFHALDEIIPQEVSV